MYLEEWTRSIRSKNNERDKVLTPKFKLNSLLLLASANIFTFDFFGVNLRPFFAPLLIYLILDIFSLSSNRMTIRKDCFHSIVLMLLITTLLILHTTCYSFDQYSSIKVSFLLLCNAISGMYVYRLIKYDLTYLLLPAILKFNIVFTCILVIAQFGLSMLHLYQPIKYGIEGIGGYGRPAALFNDPGWLAWWLGYLFIFYGILSDKFNLKQSRVVLVVIFLAAIFSGSRTLLFLLLMSFVFIYRKKVAILAIIPLFFTFAFILALIYGVPENFYYDLVDLDRNPRLNDANLIVSPVFEAGRQFVGFGAGTLHILNETNEWRNFTTSNVFLLNAFHEYGYVGLIVILILFIFSYTHLKVGKMKFFYILLFFMLNFHNATPAVFFWVILGTFFAVDQIVFSNKVQGHDDKNL